MATSEMHHFEAPPLQLQETFETVTGKTSPEAHLGPCQRIVKILNLDLIQYFEMEVV